MPPKVPPPSPRSLRDRVGQVYSSLWPQRKRTDQDDAGGGEATTSTRTTRSGAGASSKTTKPKKAPAPTKTTAAKTKAAASSAAAQGEVASVQDEDDSAAPPPPKKSKATTAKSGSNESVDTTTMTAEMKDLSTSKPSTSAKPPAKKKSMGASNSHEDLAPSKSPAKHTMKDITSPYDDRRAQALFKQYADADQTEPVIGPEGLESLCTDAEIDMGSAQPLLLAWQFDAKVMARFSLAEWRAGTAALKVDNVGKIKALVDDLEALILARPSEPQPPRPKYKGEPYARQRYAQYSQDRQDAFNKFYAYCFTLAKAEGRSIDIETATALWSVVLVPKYPMAASFVEFVNEKKAYKGVNKDLWSMLLEFCQTVDPSLSNFEADGAWPTAIDDFVEWKKAQTA